MQRSRLILSIALGLCVSIPALSAMADPAGGFDGRYKGQMTLQPSGRSDAYTSPPCDNERPAAMSVNRSYVVVYYHDWKRHLIHYKGRVAADGSVTAWHHNRDGWASQLTGSISGDQFTADITRGHCDYTLSLTKG